MQQIDIIEFLSNAQSYGLDAKTQVVRCDTHISIVFLAGDYAYKLKRAIQLPFVDFRTLESRKHFCEKELEINRISAPHLYLEVVPVTFDGELHLAGKGDVVDWLVKMHRFQQDSLFDYLCNKDALSQDDLVNLCDHVLHCYEMAEKDFHFGGFEGMQRAFDGHFKAFEKCPAGVLSSRQTKVLKGAVAQELARCADHLSKRQQDGFVRHCHGDLHLRNICFYDAKITLFDAIEFEPDYAVIDILYDLSFLLMDLCHRGRVDLANAVLNRYMAITGDVAGYDVLGLFLSSRATIRTHVNAVASANQGSGEARTELSLDAQRYLGEAIEFLKPQQPVLIAIGGFSGSGKSTLAGGLAPRLGKLPGAYVARTDMIRKRLVGVKPHVRLEQKYYRSTMTRKTYRQLYKEMEDVLNLGYCVIVDGVFAKAEERLKLEDMARQLGVPFAGVWLNAPRKILERRVENRVNDVSDANVDVVRLQSAYDVGGMSWLQVDASQGIETVLKKTLLQLDASLEIRCR